MAKFDYRCCDVCGGEAFYDANLNYEPGESADDPKYFRLAGRKVKWGMKLDYVGDWAEICTDCSTRFRTQIVPIENDAPAKGEGNE